MAEKKFFNADTLAEACKQFLDLHGLGANPAATDYTEAVQRVYGAAGAYMLDRWIEHNEAVQRLVEKGQR